NFEMKIDPSLLMECRTVRPNIPFQERVENDIEIHPYEESIPVDDNLIDLTVSINEIFILIYLLFSIINIIYLIFDLIINLEYKRRCKREKQWKKKKNYRSN